MPLLNIVVNVDADASLVDPHAVADALGIESDGEIFGVRGLDNRYVEVNFVSAEWSQETISGSVLEAGGGQISVVVDRDTESYPAVGSNVEIEVDR